MQRAGGRAGGGRAGGGRPPRAAAGRAGGGRACAGVQTLYAAQASPLARWPRRHSARLVWRTYDLKGQMERRTESSLEEYMETGDAKELVECLLELVPKLPDGQAIKDVKDRFFTSAVFSAAGRFSAAIAATVASSSLIERSATASLIAAGRVTVKDSEIAAAGPQPTERLLTSGDPDALRDAGLAAFGVGIVEVEPLPV